MRWEIGCECFLHADQRLKQNNRDVLLPAYPQELSLPIGERKWTDVEPENFLQSITQCQKQLSTLVRHGHLRREDDGAIEFWRIQAYLRKDLERSQHWSDEKWKSTIAKGEGNKQRFQYCTDPSRQEILLSPSSSIPLITEQWLIPDKFFEYIHHIGCAINLHSITNSGLITGGENLSKRQTVFFTTVDPMKKEHKDPDVIRLNAPWYKQKVWKKHQNTVYWVDINLAQKKGLKFYQTRSNAIILHETVPAYCIPKVVRMETGEVIDEKVYALPRLPPKSSLKHDWMKELGSEVARQAEGKVARQAKSFRSTPPNPNRNHDRTVRPVVYRQPVGSSSTFNEVDIDFRVSGLPHAVVNQAVNSRDRELVKKIENHPHRQDLSADQQ